MKKILRYFSLALLGLTAASLPANACTCYNTTKVQDYIAFYTYSSIVKIRIETIDTLVQNPNLPYPGNYGMDVTILENYSTQSNPFSLLRIQPTQVNLCSSYLLNAAIGDTFIISAFFHNQIPNITDTIEISICNFQTKVQNGQICAGQDCFDVNDLQDTIDAAINRRLYINTPNWQNEIVLYPNPAQNIVNIENPNGIRIEQLSLLDITGRLVLETKENNPKSINVQQLKPGLYFISIKTEKGILQRKIVVQ